MIRPSGNPFYGVAYSSIWDCLAGIVPWKRSIYERMFKQMGFWRVILNSKNGEINKMQLLSFYKRVGISNLNSVIKQIKL